MERSKNLMNRIYIPEGYKPGLDAYDTQRAIAYIKETFQEEFAKALNLKRVSSRESSLLRRLERGREIGR